MMSINLGINGFGRIGRIVFRTSYEYKFNLVAINDPAFDLEYLMYLIKFDSTHGKFNGDVHISPDCNGLIVNGSLVHVYHEKNITSIPWHSAGVEYVVEATGVFNTTDKASGHLGRGVKRVIVAAPSVDIPMFLLGVNDANMLPTDKLVSCASSTLYCMAALLHVLDRRLGVAEGLVTSVQAATAALKPTDGLCVRGKSWREHRGVLQNVIPTSSGACRAVAAVLPRLKDRLVGLALRAPIVNVSMVDLTVRLATDTSLLEIIKLVEAAGRSEMKGVIRVSHEKAVSSDFLGDQCSCILDAGSSLELNSRSFKLICWYENEYSFARRVLSTVELCARQLRRNGRRVDNIGDGNLFYQDMKIPVIVNEVIMKGKPPKAPILIHNLNAFSSNYVELQSLRSRMDLIKLWNPGERPSNDGEGMLGSKKWSSHTCQNDFKVYRRRNSVKMSPHDFRTLSQSASLNNTGAAKRNFKISSTLLRLHLPKLSVFETGQSQNEVATTRHPTQLSTPLSTSTFVKVTSPADDAFQLKGSQAETKISSTEHAAVLATEVDDGWSACPSEELLANVKPFLVTETSTTGSRAGAESLEEIIRHCYCRMCRTAAGPGHAVRRPACERTPQPVPQDIFDKLSCSSGSELDDARGVSGAESQVIDINDLALSVDDFGHLDQLCKILETSDDVADELLATLNRCKSAKPDGSTSFKDLCEKIKLDRLYDVVARRSP